MSYKNKYNREARDILYEELAEPKLRIEDKFDKTNIQSQRTKQQSNMITKITPKIK